MDKIENLIKEVLNTEPLTYYKEPNTENNLKKMEALAQCYAIQGFRTYLEEAICKSIKDAACLMEDIELHRIRQGRIIAFKELLSLSEKAFKEFKKYATNQKREENTFSDEESVRG